MKERKPHNAEITAPAAPPASSPSAAPELVFLDEFFSPVWLGMVRSIRASYPSLTKEMAEDLAGDILVKIVSHFDFQGLAGLTLHDKKRKFWAYVKAVRRGVAADFFNVHGPEIELLQDALEDSGNGGGAANGFLSSSDEEQPVPAHLSTVRRALKELSSRDRKIVLRKAEGWTFPEIQAEFLKSGYRIETGALRMRYSRALDQLKRYLRKERLLQ